MGALTQDRNTPSQSATLLRIQVAALASTFAGGICMLNAAGFAKTGAVATGERYVGRFNETVDNSAGANGDVNVEVSRKQAFKFANSSADPVLQTGLLKPCYVEDDQTVSATDGTGTRSACGVVVQIDLDGIWVE